MFRLNNQSCAKESKKTELWYAHGWMNEVNDIITFYIKVESYTNHLSGIFIKS